MAILKSERLKKMETEQEDLKQWMDLGLVPKKDIEKHKEEMRLIESKIQEEKERLRFMKENGELEEYVAPKRPSARQAYADPHTLPDMNMDSMTDAGIDLEAAPFDMETSSEDDTSFNNASDATVVEEEEEDPFSDRNRWKRGVLDDPDSDNW
jgi:hypothetical protein